MAEHYEVIIRTIIAFSALVLGVRILGKQTISQMNMFDFIASISLGSITANLAFDLSVKIHHILLTIVIFILVIYITAFISLKNRKWRKFFSGDPTVIIQNGKILEHNMRKMRYTLDYLNQQLREKDVFNISEVLFALVETNGTLSVLKKPQFRHVTKQDVNAVPATEQRLPVELIMDGEIIDDNLNENELTRFWLQTELNRRNLTLKEVVYAVMAANGNIYIDTYQDHLLNPMDIE